MTSGANIETEQKKSGLLAGYRVLDLADEKGAFTSKILADLGADVIKIEPLSGCPSRRVPPFSKNKPYLESSLFFAYHNARKRGITLNLESPTGRDLFRSLAQDTDAVVESFSAGYLSDLGIGYGDLIKTNSNLIVASISGFGEAGPYSGYKAPEAVIFAMGGLLCVSGEPGQEPCLAPGNLAYASACTFAAMAMILALYSRQRSGGQHIEASAQQSTALLTDSAIPKFSIENTVMSREGNSYRSITPGGLYKCADGYVRIVAGQLRHWKALLKWMGNPHPLAAAEWEDRAKRNSSRSFVDEIVEKFTRERTRAQLFQEGQEHQVPVTPVYTPGEFLESSFAQSRGFVVDAIDRDGDVFKTIAPPFVLDGARTRFDLPAPLLGQHNREIYLEQSKLLTEDELSRLRAAGVI